LVQRTDLFVDHFKPLHNLKSNAIGKPRLKNQLMTPPALPSEDEEAATMARQHGQGV
jgi:hypothetical protein